MVVLSTSTHLFLASLLVVSVTAHDSQRRAPWYVRADGSQSASASGADTTPSSIPVSSSSSSSSLTSTSSSASHTSAVVSSSSSITSSTTLSSSTPVTTTTTIATPSSSSSSSLPSISSSSSSTSSSHTSNKSVVLVIPPSTSLNIPSTTLEVSPDIATTSTDDSDEPTTTPSAKSNIKAASTGFWGNKGAVGGTFTVVALAIVGILAAFVLILRRRTQRRNSARDTFFDTKSPVERIERISANPSMASLRDEPMNPHATPVPNYGSGDQQPYLVDTTDYNIGYPPGAHSYAASAEQYYAPAGPQDQYAPAAAYSDHDARAYEAYNQHYSAAPAPNAATAADGLGRSNAYGVSSTDQRPSLSPHPYSHPSHSGGGGLAPPSAMRNIPGRNSGYQQSIDSFYGAAGTAL